MSDASMTIDGAAPTAAPNSQRFRLRLRWDLLVLLAPLMVLTLIVFDIPLLTTAYWSVSDADTGALTPKYFQEFYDSNAYMRIIWRTLAIALEVTIATIVVGYPLAYWTTKLRPRLRMIVLGLVVITFWVSILVRTYAWIVILGNAGLVNRGLMWLGVTAKPVEFLYNELGIVIGMTNVLLPFLVLPLYAAMIRVDQRLLQVAETLGAGRMRIFWQVFFPLTIPTLAASAILVFILSLGFYITPAVLGGGRVPLIANMMDLLINRFARWEIAAVVSVVLMAITLSLYAVYQWLRERYQ
ncbi:ABC transporter permease [Mesorhizobium sp. CN2-181]|uniref:ABC transporter permease n=1 Tax=Mesorhizobium yinganensis TaxID=3157707 RepID=UPI0032B8399A